MPPAASMTSASTYTATPSRRVPLDKRKRTETSCDKCKSRKQKCRKEPGHDACRYCLVHNIECLTTQPRKKRLYGSVEGLGSRLAMLEALLKGLVPGADLSSMDEMRRLGTQLGIALPEPLVEEPNNNLKGSGTANDDNASASASDREGDDNPSLLPDQQGQVQYIGPASSFSFHLRLRSLVGRRGIREFVLFGRNAADHDANDGDPRTLSPPSASSNVDHSSPMGDRRQSTAAEGPSLDRLIAAYFDHINPDFPVLHEASFREAYSAWLTAPDAADPAWLCSFLCVLLLARRVARITFPEDQERMWWRRVQTLLPVVIFTSSVTAVQAMMLAAVHLHNTNHRDACWNLTGTALRVAYAIGLHQDRVSATQAPQARELRKRLWWTLYAFEQMQVSSYDRPSAIEHPGPKISCPNERILGIASHYPPDYTNWQNRLVVHLGSACRAPKTVKTKSTEESYVGPLSPAAGVLRDLERWRDMLPQHLRVDALDNAPSAFQRPLLLLHAMYHYTVIVLCRAALLARASLLSKGGVDSPNSALLSMADSCSESGRELGRILIRLDSIGKFDAVTWWDTWYSLAASSVLVLDLVCLTKMKPPDVSESRVLLSQLADLATRQGRNPHVPGTLAKFASIIPDLHSMADSLYPPLPPVGERKIDSVINHPMETTHPLQQHVQEVEPYPYQHSTTNSGAYMLLDTASGRFLPEHDYAPGQYSVPRLDRNMQMGFMDFTVNNINEWNWGDLGSLLGNDGVPPTHPHSHGPPGPPPHGPS